MRNLAILSPSNNAITETFIAAHRKLPFNITFLYGAPIPHLDEKEKSRVGLLKHFTAHLKDKVFKTNTVNEKALEYHLKKNRIHIVLAEFGTTGADSLPIVKKLKLPLVVHFHGFDASIYDVLHKYRDKYLDMFNYAKSIVVVSSAMRKKLIEIGCPSEKIHLNIYGPNPMFFTNKPNLNKKKFLSVGRFIDKKAPYYTILAFSKVVQKFPDAVLTMVGQGELLATCKNLARYLKIDSNIVFEGAKDSKKILELMSSCLGFLQHSIVADNGDSEGTPVAIIEAQAAGIPVIATKHAGIPEVVINKETGFLVDEHDVDEMASKIIFLIENKELVRNLSIRATQNIKDNFSLEKHLLNLTNILNNK